MTPDRTSSIADPNYQPRTRGLKRRDQFLEAASRAFVERGFEATSLQDVVAEAGGSLATLYRLFGNKEGLFQAVLERKFESVFGRLSFPTVAQQEPRDILFNLGMGLLDMILSDEAIGIHRLMIAEAKRTPQLRKIFMELAPNRAKQYLASYLEEATLHGQLQVTDSWLSASQFIHMVMGDFYMRQLLGEEIKLNPKERRAVVDNCVLIFLFGVAVAG